MTKKLENPLTEAASKIETELARLEHLLEELGRPINSEKTLRRAGNSLEECSGSEEQLAAHLVAFGQAIQGVQARQQRCMEELNERATALRLRHEGRSALVEQLSQLGQLTSQISQPLTSLGEASGEVTAELLASIAEVAARLEQAVAEASQIAARARESDWVDLARDADGLKQQLLALKNHVSLGQRKLASQAPS